MATAIHDRCRVCGAESRLAFQHRLLDLDVGYFDCPTCGYFQTEQPYWLARAYASAINEVDTGILWRNQLNVRRVIMTLCALGRMKSRVVDHAGGYGILVRLLRDAGVDARWRDKHCENLLARGFEADGSSVDLITAFEVFEHLEHPLVELEALLQQAPSLLISTELVTQVAPPRSDWWYLGPEHGQHIGFFRKSTLAYMGARLGCHFATDGRSLHLFSKSPIPCAWRLLQRAHRLSGLVARRSGLRSKVVDDFELLRRAHLRTP